MLVKGATNVKYGFVLAVWRLDNICLVVIWVVRISKEKICSSCRHISLLCSLYMRSMCVYNAWVKWISISHKHKIDIVTSQCFYHMLFCLWADDKAIRTNLIVDNSRNFFVIRTQMRILVWDSRSIWGFFVPVPFYGQNNSWCVKIRIES